jgi:hypothetical protein
VQWIDIFDKAALVKHSEALLADKNKFWMRDFKLLAVGCANRKRTETVAAHFAFQLLNAHAPNLEQKPIGVKSMLVYQFWRHEEEAVGGSPTATGRLPVLPRP